MTVEYQNSLMTPSQVAAYVGVNRVTIYRMLNKRAFPPPMRISERVVRWRKSELDAWLDSRREGSVQ